jgi:uncharacterized protein involved in outer membrane biogenesis
MERWILMMEMPTRILKSTWFKVTGITLAVMVLLYLATRLVASYWLAQYLDDIELAVTRASGFTTKIHGKANISLFPTAGVSLNDIELKHGDQSWIKAQTLIVGFKLTPLLQRNLKISQIYISQPDIQLQAEKNALPILPPRQAPATTTDAKDKPAFRVKSLEKIVISGGRFSILSTDLKPSYVVDGLNLTVLPIDSDTLTSQALSDIQASITASFTQAQLKNIKLESTRIKARFQKNLLILSITDVASIGGAGSGNLVWKQDSQNHMIDGSFKIIGFDTARSSEMLGKPAFVNGKLDLDAKFSVKTASLKDFKKNLAGTVRISGKDIDLVSVNLDELIRKIIESQSYNLVDATAYFFVGPMGTQVTKGYDFSSVASEMKKPGTTKNKILRMISVWDVSNGIVSANDVALETKVYRLAVKGNINIVKNEFDQLRIAVVDKKGCAIAKQSINGPIQSPKIEKLNILLTLTQPVLDILGKSAKRLLSVASDCTPFYTGSLLPEPEEKSKSPSAEPPEPPKAAE